MFQFLRRVSGSFLPRPDRPWNDDATSHAPTIGRKRRYSATERDTDDSASATKRRKDDPVKLATECDSLSERESTKGDDATHPVDGCDVKEVTTAVKEVDLEDKGEAGNLSSIRPEVVPLPDSPSGSPEPEPESPESAKSDVVEGTDVNDKDSLASSSPEVVEEGVEDSGRIEEHPDTPDTGVTLVDEVTPAATVKSDLHDPPETLELAA